MGYLFRLPSNNEGTIVQYRPSFRISTILPPSTKNVRFIGGRGMPEISGKLDVPKLLWTQSFADEFWGLSAADFRATLSFQIHEMEDDLTKVNARAYRLGNVPNDGTICWGANPENRPYDLREATRIFWDAPFNTDLVNDTINEARGLDEPQVLKLYENLLTIIDRAEKDWGALAAKYPFLPPNLGKEVEWLKDKLARWAVPPKFPKAVPTPQLNGPTRYNWLGMDGDLYPESSIQCIPLNSVPAELLFKVAGDNLRVLALSYLYDELYTSGYVNPLSLHGGGGGGTVAAFWAEGLAHYAARISGRAANLRQDSAHAIDSYVNAEEQRRIKLRDLRADLKASNECSCLDCLDHKVQTILQINELVSTPAPKANPQIALVYSETLQVYGKAAGEHRARATTLAQEFANLKYASHINTYKPKGPFKDQTKFFIGAANVAIPLQVDAVFLGFDRTEIDKVPPEYHKTNSNYTFVIGFARYLGGTRYLVDFGGYGMEWCTTQRKLFSMRSKVASQDAVPAS